jgi:hypothetical protein
MTPRTAHEAIADVLKTVIRYDIAELRDLLRECHETLANYSDVFDGANGPLPNRELSVMQDIDEVLDRLPAPEGEWVLLSDVQYAFEKAEEESRRDR